jgi:hypothetical protein
VAHGIGGGKDLGGGLGHEHVVFDADAAEIHEAVHAVPAHGVAMALALAGILEQGGDEVDAGLHRHDVALLERQVGAQHRQPRARAARTAGQESARVAHAEAHHVAETVREEQRVRVALDQRLRRAREQAELHQAIGDLERRLQMEVAPFRTGQAARDGVALDAQHQVVQRAEERVVAAGRRYVRVTSAV